MNRSDSLSDGTSANPPRSCDGNTRRRCRTTSTWGIKQSPKEQVVHEMIPSTPSYRRRYPCFRTCSMYRWFAAKKAAYRTQLTNALKLWQKSGYKAESRATIRARAANRVCSVKTDLFHYVCSGKRLFEQFLAQLRKHLGSAVSPTYDFSTVIVSRTTINTFGSPWRGCKPQDLASPCPLMKSCCLPHTIRGTRHTSIYPLPK